MQQIFPYFAFHSVFYEVTKWELEATGIPWTPVCDKSQMWQANVEVFGVIWWSEQTFLCRNENECAITLVIADGFHQHKLVQ